MHMLGAGHSQHEPKSPGVKPARAFIGSFFDEETSPAEKVSYRTFMVYNNICKQVTNTNYCYKLDRFSRRNSYGGIPGSPYEQENLPMGSNNDNNRDRVNSMLRTAQQWGIKAP